MTLTLHYHPEDADLLPGQDYLDFHRYATKADLDCPRGQLFLLDDPPEVSP